MTLAQLRRIAEPYAMMFGGVAILIIGPLIVGRESSRANALDWTMAVAAGWFAWVLFAGAIDRWREAR